MFSTADRAKASRPTGTGAGAARRGRSAPTLSCWGPARTRHDLRLSGVGAAELLAGIRGVRPSIHNPGVPDPAGPQGVQVAPGLDQLAEDRGGRTNGRTRPHGGSRL